MVVDSAIGGDGLEGCLLLLNDSRDDSKIISEEKVFIFFLKKKDTLLEKNRGYLSKKPKPSIFKF